MYPPKVPINYDVVDYRKAYHTWFICLPTGHIHIRTRKEGSFLILIRIWPVGLVCSGIIHRKLGYLGTWIPRISATFNRKHDFPVSTFEHITVRVELIVQSMVKNVDATLVSITIRGHTSKSGKNWDFYSRFKLCSSFETPCMLSC